MKTHPTKTQKRKKTDNDGTTKQANTTLRRRKKT